MATVTTTTTTDPATENFGDQRKLKMYTNATNSTLVGAALIASITFPGFGQAPQGLFFSLVCCIYNRMSFYTAVATMITGAGAALPPEPHASIDSEVLTMRKWVRASSMLLAVSTICVLGAVPGPNYEDQPSVWRNKVVSTVNCIGLFVCSVAMTAYIIRGRFLHITAESCSSSCNKLHVDRIFSYIAKKTRSSNYGKFFSFLTIESCPSFCEDVGLIFVWFVTFALFLALLFFLPSYGKFPGEYHPQAPIFG